ncbi:MAG TPA: pyrroline-5-carboxylate reductase [Clostridiaceae bacterium]|nr:pyrroline-5-carboxylate reductase [Clostridiaceae bacterium]
MIGFVGAGNMASALIGGFLDKHVLKQSDIMVYDVSQTKAKLFEERFDIDVAADLSAVFGRSDYIVLSCSPESYADVLAAFKTFCLAKPQQNRKTIIALAPHFSLATLVSWSGSDNDMVRLMPNTPALVQKGVFALADSDTVSKTRLAEVEALFSPLGLVKRVPERLFNAFTAAAGSSPAYVALFIEALTEASVRHGLSWEDALDVVAHTVLGSASLLLEKGLGTGEMKQMVSTPGGATIAAVLALEANGFRHAIDEAVGACIEAFE